MGKLVLNNPHVTVDGNDLSAEVLAITLNYGAELVENTSGGDGTRGNIAGLKNWSMEFEFNQDFATGQLDSILFPLVGTEVVLAVRPTTSAKGVSNPEYGGTGILENYSPLGQSIGDAVKTNPTFQPASSSPILTRATS